MCLKLFAMRYKKKATPYACTPRHGRNWVFETNKNNLLIKKVFAFKFYRRII